MMKFLWQSVKIGEYKFVNSGKIMHPSHLSKLYVWRCPIITLIQNNSWLLPVFFKLKTFIDISNIVCTWYNFDCNLEIIWILVAKKWTSFLNIGWFCLRNVTDRHINCDHRFRHDNLYTIQIKHKIIKNINKNNNKVLQFLNIITVSFIFNLISDLSIIFL